MSAEVSEGKKSSKKRLRLRRERGRLHAVADKSSGIYYLRGTIHGSKVRESTGTSDATAADAIRVKREAELLTESVHGKKVVSTFADCVVHYLNVRGSTSYSRYLKGLVEEFGNTKAREMTTPLVHAYIARVMSNHSGASRNTMVVNPIISVLRCAAEAGLCDQPTVQRFEETSEAITGAPPEWVAEFLTTCAKPKLRAYVALLTTTGCRGIDAVRLRSEHVNYERGTAYLPTTKNDDSRTLQIVSPVAALLQSFKHSPRGTVFGYARTDMANKEIERECKRLGMAYYSGHRFGRHAFAERLLNEGRTLQEVMKAGGWRDITTLSRKYGHLEQSRVDEVVREQASAVMRTGLRVVK